MKLHQMVMTDVVRSTESEVAEIELAEAKLRAHFRLVEPEVAEVRFVDAVLRFVVAVAPAVASIADFSTVDAPMAVKQMNAPVLALMPRNLEACWRDDIPFIFRFHAVMFEIRVHQDRPRSRSFRWLNYWWFMLWNLLFHLKRIFFECGIFWVLFPFI